jgi:L,D-peptidoglycan transpeptidase YkuD (ErfK/YbiS/YcfS/YnhG family)
MARADHLYDIVGILDWNITRRALGRGSAIFLHQSRADRGPTAGCIALERDDLRLLLHHLRPDSVFMVA